MQNIELLLQPIKGLNQLKQVVQYYGIQLDNHNRALCPFHKEKTPSFFIYVNGDGEGCFKCHGCGEGGDIINFIQQQECCTFNEAVRKAYDILGLEFDWEYSNIENFIKFLKENQANYMDSYVYTNEQGNPVYMKVKYWDDTYNKKTFTTKELVPTEKSYKFGKDFSTTPKHIYNLQYVLKAIENKKYVVFVEGEKDCETLIKRGFTATTIYSKHWEDNYTKELTGADIVFIGDTGQAGEEFKQLVWHNLKSVVKSFKVVNLKGIEELGDNKDVTDWLEAGHTKKELLTCINKGWDWCISTKWKDVIVKEKNGEQQIIPLNTSDNLQLLLQRNGTTIKYNIITKEISATSENFYNRNLNTLSSEIKDEALREGLKLSIADVIRCMEEIAHKHEYDPFKDYLDSLNGKWDKVSRIQEYMDCFVTAPTYNNELKEILFKNWLMQFVDSTYNNHFTSQGMLVLKGAQGIFKTTSMSYLIPFKDEDWCFLAEQKYNDNRDCIQTITSRKLVELSEFARSAKAVDSLKGFVTAPVDRMVLKYDKFPTDYKRKTIFYATVNDDEFLVDDENRRFWVVDIESLNVDKLKDFNYDQLWAELYYLYHVKGQTKCYLTKEEQQLLKTSNMDYQYKGDNATLIQLTFDFNSDIKLWLNNTEINDFLRVNTGKTIPDTVLGRELKKLGFKYKDTGKYGKRAKYFPLPIPREWKGKVKSDWTNRIVEDSTTPQFIEVSTGNVTQLPFKNKKKTGTDVF